MMIHDALFEKVGDPITMGILFYLVHASDVNGIITKSYSEIAKEIGYTKNKVYRCIQKLESLNAVEITDRHQGTKGIITVCNISSYKRKTTLAKHPSAVEKKETSNNADDVFFEDEKMNEAIKKWLRYKSEKKQTYKPVGLEALKKKLIKLSSGDGDIAMKVVEQSMSNNWAGLFPLREERKDSNQDIGIVLHNSQEKDYNKGKW